MRKYLALVTAAFLIALPFMLMSPAKANSTPPLKVVEIFHHEVSDNADICTTSWIPSNPRVGTLAYRLTIVLESTDSVVEVQIVSGATTVEADLNAGTALTAGKIYTFTFGASDTYSFNLHCETATTVGFLLVEEIRDGAL